MRTDLINILQKKLIKLLGLRWNDKLKAWDGEDIDLSSIGLTSIPLKFGIVRELDLSNNRLVNLISAPIKCGILRCYNNRLTSLAGIGKVYDTLTLENNQLKNLNGLNNNKIDYFYCSENQLTSLQGGPAKAIDYIADDNNLVNLEGGPSVCKEIFSISRNRVTSLQGSPKGVMIYYCDSNNLKTLDGIISNNINTINASYNHLVNLDVSNMPKLRSLYLNYNNIETIKVGQDITQLSLTNNNIKSLKGLKLTWAHDVKLQNNPLENLEGVIIYTDLLSLDNRFMELEYSSNKINDDIIANHIYYT